MKKFFLKDIIKVASFGLYLGVFVVALIASNLVVAAQTPGTNTPDDPNQTSVGLPLPNRSSSSTNSVASSARSSSINPAIPASNNPTPAVPQNFTPPTTTVRSGGFSTFLIYFIIVSAFVGVGYYYKNNQKTALKTHEKKIGR